MLRLQGSWTKPSDATLEAIPGCHHECGVIPFETHSCEAQGLEKPGDSWVLEKASTTFKRSSYHQYGGNAPPKKQIKEYLYIFQAFSLSILSHPGIKNETTSLVPGEKKRLKILKLITSCSILLAVNTVPGVCWICYIFNKCVDQHDFLCDVNKIQQSCDTHVNLDNNLSQYHYAKNWGSKNYELEKYPKTHAWRCCNESHCCVCKLKK